MTCERKTQPCECVGRRAALKLFCPDWSEPEKRRDATDIVEDSMWRTIPLADRARCIVFLRKAVPPDVVEKWRATYNRGNRIGSDDIRFHFGVGMAVRNTLRSVLKDDQLPGNKNWDDYYMGALNTLVEKVDKIVDVPIEEYRPRTYKITQREARILTAIHLLMSQLMENPSSKELDEQLRRAWNILPSSDYPIATSFN